MNEHANYKDGYIVFEDSGTSPIAYGACEKWFSTYDEAIEYATNIVKKRTKEFKEHIDCNSVIVFVLTNLSIYSRASIRFSQISPVSIRVSTM